MNENINLCEILKGLEGIKLYCLITGEYVTLESANSTKFYNRPIHVTDKNGISWFYLKNGNKYSNGECMLVPSKENWDWDKFQKPIKAGTPMMCRLKSGDWALRYYAGIIDGEHRVFRNDNTIADGFQNGMIPFDKFNPNDIEESLKYNIQK